MPDKWGWSTGNEIVDRALWRLQRWAGPIHVLLVPVLITKIEAARMVGAKDKDIATALNITEDQLNNLMEGK